MVLGVFEVRVHRSESRGRNTGEQDAEGPNGVCLQDTPGITNAFFISQGSTDHSDGSHSETEARRTIQMDQVHRMTKNDSKVARHNPNPTPTSLETTTEEIPIIR